MIKSGLLRESETGRLPVSVKRKLEVVEVDVKINTISISQLSTVERKRYEEVDQ